MAEFRLYRTDGDGESGDYQLRFGDEVKRSWSEVTTPEARDNAKGYIVEEVLAFGPPEARAAFKQVAIHIPFTDESDQS